MISRNEFDAYSKAVEQIGNKAASDVESSVLNWCSQNPAASVAEKREAAKLIMEGYVQGYDDIASEFAAEWYDHRAKSEGVSLDQAITMAVYSPEKSDAVARYQARKLAKGGDAAFAKACGEYARNDAFRSLNETIIANVGRDKANGVRFARVTTGRETCAFCLMLASRGAVYHTRKTAGDFKSFHRGCDCKVVPGFENDPLAVLVEGHDPKAILSSISIIERETGLSFFDSRNSKILKEFLELHDAGWITSGVTPEVEYADEFVRKKKMADANHAAEIRTANRLRRFGIRTVFVDDEPSRFDESKGIYQVVGLPDLDSGLEIKSVSSASSENTISKHIGKSKKKAGYKQVVIDVSENTSIDDDTARAMIANSLRRHGMQNALMVNHLEEIEMIFPN